MTQLDPIIAVKNIEESSTWYQRIFGWKRKHGGNDFAVLVTENDEVLLCLHAWEKHGHPTMQDSSTKAGNGLILYFRTADLESIRKNVEKAGAIVEEEIHVNPNSSKREFSIRDPDGYYLTISDFHTYDG